MMFQIVPFSLSEFIEIIGLKMHVVVQASEKEKLFKGKYFLIKIY